MIKIAADTPTAAKKPPKLGPLASAAWRIRQLGNERLEALKRAEKAEGTLATIEIPDESGDYLPYADLALAYSKSLQDAGKLSGPGSWAWAVEQLARGLMVRRESTTGSHKLRLDKENQGRLCCTFVRVPGKKDWESANIFLSDFEATDWAVWP